MPKAITASRRNGPYSCAVSSVMNTPAHYQSRYYRHRLCGGDVKSLAAAMADDGYGPVTSWFVRWDEAADRRGLQLERHMGLACGKTARSEFLNEAMRQMMRELSRKAKVPAAAGAIPAEIPQSHPATLAEPSAALPAA